MVISVSSSNNRVLFWDLKHRAGAEEQDLSTTAHQMSPDWLHHSVQGVFWDNETRWWLKYLVWQRETLSRAVVSAPAKTPLVELLVQWARVKLGWCWGDVGGFEVILEDLRCWTAQLCSTFPASASPRAEQMLSPRWSHRTCSLPECEAGLRVGHRNLCQHQELSATRDPGDPSSNFSSAQEATEHTTKLEHRAVPTTNDGLKFNFWRC